MKLKFGKEDVKSVLESYYREYEDFDGVINIECKIGTGFCLNETYPCAELAIEAVGKLSIFGREVPMVRKITEEDVKGVFKTVVEALGYTVNAIDLDYGLNTSCVGYGVDEGTVRKPYFNGVDISLKNKTYVR